MEDEIKTKELLEMNIRECIDGLKYAEQGGEQHAQLTADIQRLVAAYAELEKLDSQKFDSERKFREEIRQYELDREYKDILDRAKMAEEKKSGWRDAGIKICGIILPLGLYFLLAAAGIKLEYIDHGSVSTFSLKELFRIFHPKIVS